MNAQSERPLSVLTCCREFPEKRDRVEAAEDIELINPGFVLDGRFVLGEVVSIGGMAVIYKANDILHESRVVAVKIPHSKYERDPSYIARFEHEEKIGLVLDHPALLKFVSVEGKKSRPYLVTEYLAGCTLARLIHQWQPLPESDALRIASLIAEAVQYMHQHGFIHRDLKPDNIMLCSDHSIRVMDFGLAAPVASPWDKFADWVPIMGTPQYMAPEQVKRTHNDVYTDVYSLGVVLYEMLTGQLPFGHEDPWVMAQARVRGDPVAPRKIAPGISPQAEEIVLHAMQRKPANRYKSLTAFRKDLNDPQNVKVTGYCNRLKHRRWNPSYEQAQLIFGLNLAAGIFVFLMAMFYYLSHRTWHR